jgi:hypothetical protein
MTILRRRPIPLLTLLRLCLVFFLLPSSVERPPLVAQDTGVPIAAADQSSLLTWPFSHSERVTAATAFLTVGFFWLFRARERLPFWTAVNLGLILALAAALMIGWGASSSPSSNPGGTKTSPQNQQRPVAPAAGSETQSAKI